MKHEFVYVREEVLYFDDEAVHLPSHRAVDVAPQDRALLELVYRGEGELFLLCDRVTELSSGADPTAIEASLRETLTHPDCLLELCDGVEIVDPEVIVCDFSGSPGAIDSRALVRHLRRDRRVLFLGAESHVRGPIHQNLSFEASKRARLHSGWFQFVQWCRAVVRKSADATLVLCGPQDAILFGDQTPFVRTVLAVGPDWPSRAGGGDLLGADWVPEDGFDATRGLFYALSFHPQRNLHELHRANGSDFAILEGIALRHAEQVLVCAADQGPFLQEAGRDAASIAWAHPYRLPRAARGSGPGRPRSVVLVADLEAGAEPLVPFIMALDAIPAEQRAFDEVLVWTSGGVFRAVVEDGGGRLESVPGPAPGPDRVVFGWVVPDLLRDLRHPAFALSRGFPCQLVSSGRPHPLLADADPVLRARDLSPAGLAATVARARDPEDGTTAAILRAQRRLLDRSAAARRVTRILQAEVQPC